jgi:hypothetical protein
MLLFVAFAPLPACFRLLRLALGAVPLLLGLLRVFVLCSLRAGFGFRSRLALVLLVWPLLLLLPAPSAVRVPVRGPRWLLLLVWGCRVLFGVLRLLWFGALFPSAVVGGFALPLFLPAFSFPFSSV